jgi:hypothetical protein
MVVPKPPLADIEPLPESGSGCGLCPNTTMTPIDKYDFYVPLTKEERENTKHTEPLRVSFLQIKEGDVEKGIEWYRHYYPKLPSELVEIMARYNFGDLKFATRKSIRNNGKKYTKVHKLKPPISQGLVRRDDKQIITFD